MVSGPTGCDLQQVDRYRDGELDQEESRSVSAHIADCRRCRAHLDSIDLLGRTFTSRLAAGLDSSSAAGLAERTIRRINGQSVPRPSLLTRIFATRKVWVPAGAMAVALMVAIFFGRFSGAPEPIPSAIIHSFRADTASVMIMETRETHQTVIWFTEES